MRTTPCLSFVSTVALFVGACSAPPAPGDASTADATDANRAVDAHAMDVRDAGSMPTDVPRMDTAVTDTVVTDVVTVSDAGRTDAPVADTGGLLFPAGTICNDSGSPRTPPATYAHLIVFLMENKSLTAVQGASAAPYFNSLTEQCGYSTRFLDNVFTTNLVSLPHYLALTSGSNCNTGLGNTTQTPGATGCITDDQDSTAHRLSTRSIFEQVTSWRAYQESMPSACAMGSSSPYATKHNPPPYYSRISGADCSANDISVAHVSCPTSVNTRCGTPDNAFTRDLANDTLPQFAFFTPDLVNDMHDGTVSQGDNFLHTYLPLVFASPAYRRGEVAVYVMWDEASPPNPQPNLFISPYTPPTMSTMTMNLFAVLRTMEDQLGISTHLGCAGGMPPGGIGSCPSGSNADLRTEFNF
jgi:hypothetical protein